LKTCATCAHWKATEIVLEMPEDTPPHMRTKAETNVEMIKATWALCTWPETETAQAAIKETPFWVAIPAGMMTHEDHGEDCPVWKERAPIDF